MMKCTYVLSVLLAVAAGASARTVTDLSGNEWTCDGLPVRVPHTWNAIDGADGLPGGKVTVDGGSSVKSDSYLRKRAHYVRALPDPTAGKRVFLRFHGASIKTDVLVNGTKVGSHAGAFTMFTFEITSALKPSGNRLEVFVDNRRDDTTNPINADFNMAGGLYRKVELIETDAVCIDPCAYGTDGVVLHADPETGKVRAEVKVSGGPDVVREFAFPQPKLWSPENPNLYSVEIKVGTDSIVRKVGFRKAEMRDGLFYLNGRRTKVRGVNRHEDREGKGWALDAGDCELDVRIIRAMGANAIRLAHGAHGQEMVDLMDERGLMAFVAIPFVEDVRGRGDYVKNAKDELLETVAQYRNHPSVIWWDLFNEIYNNTPGSKPGSMEPLLREMYAVLREADGGEHILMGTTNGPDRKELNAIPDYLAYNAYPLWYRHAEMKDLLDRILRINGRKTICLGEYGAGGSVYQHANPVRASVPASPFHSEEYQVEVHLRAYREIKRRDDVWGSYIWNMFDFGADSRAEGDRHGVNDKGMVTRDRVTAKDVFYFYKANWNPEPMLHLSGKRMTRVDLDKVTVRAFSNLGKPVTLYVNGEKRGELTPDDVNTVTWDGVPLKVGDNEIKVVSDGREDACTWRW